MGASPVKQAIPFTQFDQLREARDIVRQEADALTELAKRLDTRFCDAVELIMSCCGRVVVTGIGKAGHIGQKLTATLSSTGTPAHFLHPAEAMHGDFGSLGAGDVVLALSNSGETPEICSLLGTFHHLRVPIIAITATATNSLARQADVVLEIGRQPEAGILGLAPSTSTTMMLALGDALALVVSRLKGFTAQDFGIFHPGGNLGRQLTSIRDVMRCGSELRIAQEHETVRETLRRLSSSGRRTGAILIVDAEGQLTGLFTDSDLARLLERHRDEQLDRPIQEVMTRGPTTIRDTAFLSHAVTLLTERKISELPVVDGSGVPIGLIDITDVIGLTASPDPRTSK